MIKNKSINHHNMQPPNVKSLKRPRTVSPIRNRSTPNSPKNIETISSVEGFYFPYHKLPEKQTAPQGEAFEKVLQHQQF